MKRRWRRRQRARADVAFFSHTSSPKPPTLVRIIIYEREREKSAWHTKSREIDMDDSRHNAALSGAGRA
jgi:hypothetical protein